MFWRDKAHEAYRKRDVKGLHAAHKEGSVHASYAHYLKSGVYGGLDGIITTFAVVAGVAGASLDVVIVLILGFSNLIADGLSMAIGDYLSSKSEQEYIEQQRKKEAWEVLHHPKGEKKEMIQIYKDRGLASKEAHKIVNIISKKKKAFVNVMLCDKLGFDLHPANPIHGAAITFISFAAFGFVPLLAFIIPVGMNTFNFAIILTGITLFTLGAVKVYFTERNWIKSGLETLFVGGIAALAAYLIGAFVASLV